MAWLEQGEVALTPEPAWSEYRDRGIPEGHYIPKQPVYCLVSLNSGSSGNRLFESKGSHAEVNMITALKQPSNPQPLMPRAVDPKFPYQQPPTDIYIYLNSAPCGAGSKKSPTSMNCATRLRQFSKEYYVMLHIRAVDPFNHNEQELYQLKTSPYVTLSAFNEQDWKNLATLLRYQLPPNWVCTDPMSARDSRTAYKFDHLLP